MSLSTGRLPSGYKARRTQRLQRDAAAVQALPNILRQEVGFQVHAYARLFEPERRAGQRMGNERNAESVAAVRQGKRRPF